MEEGGVSITIFEPIDSEFGFPKILFEFKEVLILLREVSDSLKILEEG